MDFIDLVLLGGFICFGLALIVMANRLRAARALAADALAEQSQYGHLDEKGTFLGYRGTGTDQTVEVTAPKENMRNLLFLEAVFENLSEGISLTDADLNIVAFNRQFLDLLGFPPEKFKPGDPFEKFIRYNAEHGEYGPGDPDEQVRERVALAKLFQPHQFERPRPGGVVLEIRGNPIPSGGFVTTYTDISARVRGERALRESQASLENAQRIAQLGNWDWDIQADSMTWSDQNYRIFGLAVDQFGANVGAFLDRVHPDDRATVRAAIDGALAGAPYALDCRIVRPDGSERIIHSRGEVTFDADGAAVLMRGTAQDVTERKRAEETVQQKTAFAELSKQVSAAANEATSVNHAMAVSIKEICRHTGWPVGHVFLLDRGETAQLRSSHIWHMEQPDLHHKLRAFTAANPFAADTWGTGHGIEDARYRGFSDLAKEASSPRARLARDMGFEAMFGFPIVIGSEVSGMLEFFSESAGAPNPATLEVMTHVGTQLGLVVERASAQHSLLAAEYANRSKTEFLATMSHELRTPLNAIIGFSELMGKEIYGALGHPNYIDYAEDIRDSGLHLLEIINDILDVSKAEAGRIELSEEHLNLAEAIDGAVRLIRPRMQDKPIELKLDLPAAPIYLVADELRFRQVLLNLLSNAVKFTDKGSITVRARAVPEIGLEVQIIDTGIGVGEADVERIFEPFAQADSTLSRPHEGTGLGLPLSRKLVELHGGTLTLESTLGEGSVATIRIPPQRLLSESDVA